MNEIALNQRKISESMLLLAVFFNCVQAIAITYFIAGINDIRLYILF